MPDWNSIVFEIIKTPDGLKKKLKLAGINGIAKMEDISAKTEIFYFSIIFNSDLRHFLLICPFPFFSDEFSPNSFHLRSSDKVLSKITPPSDSAFWIKTLIFQGVFLLQDPYHNTYSEKLCRHRLFQPIAHTNKNKIKKNSSKTIQRSSKISYEKNRTKKSFQNKSS